MLGCLSLSPNANMTAATKEIDASQTSSNKKDLFVKQEKTLDSFAEDSVSSDVDPGRLQEKIQKQTFNNSVKHDSNEYVQQEPRIDSLQKRQPQNFRNNFLPLNRKSELVDEGFLRVKRHMIRTLLSLQHRISPGVAKSLLLPAVDTRAIWEKDVINETQILSSPNPLHPLRVWIIDNSGSMVTKDTYRIAGDAGLIRQTVPCTRWEELKDVLSYQSKLSTLLGSPTEFRFVNDPQIGRTYCTDYRNEASTRRKNRDEDQRNEVSLIRKSSDELLKNDSSLNYVTLEENAVILHSKMVHPFAAYPPNPADKRVNRKKDALKASENLTQAQLSARMRMAAKAVAIVAKKSREEQIERNKNLIKLWKTKKGTAFDRDARTSFSKGIPYKYDKSQTITVCSSEKGKSYGYSTYDQIYVTKDHMNDKKVEAEAKSVSEAAYLNQVISETEPRYKTPLSPVVTSVIEDIKLMENKLRGEGQKVVVVIATDGLPDDIDLFLTSVKELEKLSVQLTIRLFTSDPHVISFWNSLDINFQSSFNVLQNYITTAENVHSVNKWANYTMSLHRCREWGFHNKLMHIIDEAPLSHMQLRDYCAFLFGIDAENLPNPITQWKNFHKYVESKQKLLTKQWNPLTQKLATWIDLEIMNEIYGEKKVIIRTKSYIQGPVTKKAKRTPEGTQSIKDRIIWKVSQVCCCC